MNTEPTFLTKQLLTLTDHNGDIHPGLNKIILMHYAVVPEPEQTLYHMPYHHAQVLLKISNSFINTLTDILSTDCNDDLLKNLLRTLHRDLEDWYKNYLRQELPLKSDGVINFPSLNAYINAHNELVQRYYLLNYMSYPITLNSSISMESILKNPQPIYVVYANPSAKMYKYSAYLAEIDTYDIHDETITVNLTQCVSYGKSDVTLPRTVKYNIFNNAIMGNCTLDKETAIETAYGLNTNMFHETLKAQHLPFVVQEPNQYQALYQQLLHFFQSKEDTLSFAEYQAFQQVLQD